MTTQTSKEAYAVLDITPLQEKVILALNHLEEACISDVAAYLNMERSTVAGRFNELYEKNMLFYVGKKKSQRTNINSEHYRLRMPNDRQDRGRKPEGGTRRKVVSFSKYMPDNARKSQLNLFA